MCIKAPFKHFHDTVISQVQKRVLNCFLCYSGCFGLCQSHESLELIIEFTKGIVGNDMPGFGKTITIVMVLFSKGFVQAQA